MTELEKLEELLIPLSMESRKTVGAPDKVRSSSEELKDCLNKLIEVGEKRPVFIAGRVPLVKGKG